MRNLVVLCYSVVAVTAADLSAQSFVQISSLRAHPARLNCVGPGATAHIRLQIFAAGLPDDAKQGSARVTLSIYSAHPSVNTLQIREATQDLPLAESPVLADFEVNCTADTLPGAISIGATIVRAPPGILIKEPLQPAIVEIAIDPVPR